MAEQQDEWTIGSASTSELLAIVRGSKNWEAYSEARAELYRRRSTDRAASEWCSNH